ncbi:MAG: DUF389 domain-containing protein [Myxococcales bacterium]|nr:MAG: DUF389 domain-containing protein [Myxococcales bacterium]
MKPGEAPVSLARRTWHGLQDRLLQMLGKGEDRRNAVVRQMLHRDANESLSYWLQLGVSVGIATLGLVVGSAAVVIGAMLIAPLMGPIVALAMGLATGSPFLVLRSAGRILLSIAVAISGAAFITVLLPFHELNSELTARSTPTALDLLTAGFCALAGVYASLRSGSDTAATAAGTSIGISLVPPLCASGYGLGTSTESLARGAGLLFLTNLVAIVAVGSACFLAAGFNRADVLGLERDELARGEDAPIARVLARRLSSLFESRLGPLLRFIMPFALLALVYLPLRRALNEVAWEVTVRRAVREALDAEQKPIVESKAQVKRHAVELVVVLLGTTADAEASRARLEERVARAAGVKPHLEVIAVPDSRAFAGLESTLLTPNALASAAAAPPPPMGQRARQTVQEVSAEVRKVWPSATMGALGSVAVESQATGIRLTVRHWGDSLPPTGKELLEKSLAAALESRVIILDEPLPLAKLNRARGDEAFLSAAGELARAARGFPEAVLCVERPAASPKRRRASEQALSAAFDQVVASAVRKQERAAEDFSLSVASDVCFAADEQAPPGADGAPTP